MSYSSTGQETDLFQAIEWARGILANRDKYYILDTETTGLSEPEIVEIAIMDLNEQVIVNQRFNPVGEPEAGAIAIHGMDRKTLTRYPRWDVVADRMAEILSERTLLIYNAGFDDRALRVTHTRSGRALPDLPMLCVMGWYSQYVGEWSDYHKNYRWQKLPGGDHSAIGDCLATLEVIKEMAQS